MSAGWWWAIGVWLAALGLLVLLRWRVSRDVPLLPDSDFPTTRPEQRRPNSMERES